MINWNWECSTVDVYPQKEEHTDVVFKVYWTLIGTNENGINDKSDGIHELDTSSIIDFVPFENLTQEQVISWAHDEMGEDLITELKQRIIDKINEQVTPSYVNKTIAPAGPVVPE